MKAVLSSVLCLAGTLMCGSLLAQEISVLSLQQCIDLSLQKNADVLSAQASTDEYRARVAEVQSSYYPKLTVLAYAAPMFTVRGDALHENVERRYDPDSWGPSTHLEMLLAMPVYTFGRLESGIEAAQARLGVERARLREAENRVRLEVVKLYYTHLFAVSIKKELDSAKSRLAEVQLKAQELYDAATGNVTKADLMRLRFAELELDKYHLMAGDGISISLAALKHLVGMAHDEGLQLADAMLAEPVIVPLETVENLLTIANQNRPEWAQIENGIQAAISLRKSEAATKRPIVFVAGSLESNWTPTRDHTNNPYHYDPYNGLSGGVALGAKLDLDWALSKAKVDRANAELSKVNALQQKALTGIPVQVQKAQSDMLRLSEQLELSREAMKATRKWVVFSTASYMGGVGEVKDVLEGLAAMMQSKRDNLETSLQYYIAQAELNYALGQ